MVMLLMALQSTHMRQLPSFFGTKNDRNRTRTKALTYIPAVQKVLDLALNLLSLLRICPICSTVGQARSRNQINLIPAGVKGSKVIFFPLCMKVYLLLLPWCLASVSYSQGLPNKREHASIGMTSQSAKSEYIPMKKCTRTVCVTLTFPESLNH